MNPLHAFDRILHSLHRAALDPAHWPAASALIDDASGAVGSALFVGEGLGEHQPVYFAMCLSRGERRQDLEREYLDAWYRRDEAIPRLRELPAGRLVHIPRLYTDDEKRTSPVWNEGLPRVSSQDGLNVHLDGHDGLRIVWTIGNPVGGRGWQSAQLRLIERLLPHVRHFARVRQALAAADALGASLTALLDNSRIGVLHLDRYGRIVEANAPGLEILRRADGLFDRDGTLHAWLPADHDRLQKLLGRALPALWGDAPGGGSMTLRRSSDRARLALHVCPVGDARTDFGARRVAALVLVVDPAGSSRVDPVRVADTLGLTPTEGRVAALLGEGRSVRDIAAATGNQPGTVRLFLKHVYRKQGVSGQVPLVRRVVGVDALPRP